MKKKNITKQQLVEVFKEKITKKEACQRLGISITFLNEKLKEYKLCPQLKHWRKGKFDIHPEIDTLWLTTNWLNTDKSLHILAQENNLDLKFLELRAKHLGISKKYKHFINETKLKNLQDPHLWYLGGLIATDGYLTAKGCWDTVCLEFVGESETNLLTQIKDYYDSSSPIRYHTNSKSVYWRFHCEGLYELLDKYFGIPTSDKTHNLHYPKFFPSEDCAKAYIRGVIDGDGYIGGEGRYRLDICTASQAFVEGVQHIIYTYTKEMMPFRFEQRSSGKYPSLSSNKKSRYLNILDWVYSLENCFKLDRKYKKYLSNKKRKEGDAHEKIG